MKVTGMFPTIVCRNYQDVIDFAENELGFDIVHKIHAIISDDENDHIYIMKNEEGIRFDIVQFDVDKPFNSLCMNVDDFDEAKELLEKRGWHIFKGPEISNNSKKALLKSCEGLLILLIQHYS